MANITINNLPPVTSLNGTEQFPLDQTSVTLQTTLNAMGNFILNSANTVSTAGNITSGAAISGVSMIASGNVTAAAVVANTITAGNLVATNITGNIANTTGGYGNTNVNMLLGNLGVDIIPNGNNVTSLGNATNQFKDLYLSNATLYFDSVPMTVAGTTLQVNGENVVTTSAGNTTTQGNINVSGNITAENVIGNVAVANVVGLGNVATVNLNDNGATYLAGNGSWQTISAGSNYGDANVAAYLPTNTADVNATNLTTDANAAIHGDLTVGQTWGPVSIVSVVSSTPTTVTLRAINQLPFPIPSVGSVLISGATGGQSGLNGLWDIVSVSAPNFVITNSSQPTTGMTGGASCIVYYGGDISASGNITGAYLLGNIANATGLGNIVSTNLNGNGTTYLAGNGSWQTVSAGSSYSNANVAAYLPVNSANVAGNNFTVSGNVNAGSFGSPEQLLSYTANATTVTFDLMGSLPPPFSAGQTMQIYGIQPGEPTELNGYWPVVSCDGLQVVITCNLQPTLPLGFTTFGRVAYIRNVSATGNVTGQYILGNIANATGLGNIVSTNLNGNGSQYLAGNGAWVTPAAGYSNADVSTYLASGTNTTNIITTGNTSGSFLMSTNSSGNEGGEIQLALAAANTTLTTGVSVDIYQNQLRFYERGGTNRGAYIDLGNAAASVGTLLNNRSSTIAAANTKVQLNNITAQIGGTPTRLYMGTVTGNMTVAGQTQTMLSGSTATSSWINVPLQSGVGNEFAVGGAISQNGELTVFNFTDQGAGTGSWRVTAIIANTASNLYSVTIEKLA